MKPSDFLTELSNDKLTQYKTAAAADASKADKEGDFKKGDKRFSGIVKATKKQFDNDAKKDVEEGWKDVVAGGAMALGALGAGAQTMPDINVQRVELANKYYNVLVQRAKEDGIKLDTRTLNVIKAKAQDAAAKKTQQSTYQQGFSGQGSERKVAKDAGQFESQGVAEGILGSDPNRGQKVPDWAKRGIVGKIGRKLDPAWSDVQMTVPQHLLSKQSSVPTTNSLATKDMPKATSITPTRAILQRVMTKPSHPVTKNGVTTIADKQGVAEGQGSIVDKCASLAAKYFNSAGLQQQYDIDEFIKINTGDNVVVDKCASLATKYFNSAGLQQQYDIGEYIKANVRQGVAEGWSQKYKSSINCSHPKGFSQKAHCAGKKKHNESIEMEMVCEDCGMCETHTNHENLDEACWKGYHKEGNKKMFGKTYPNCVKNEGVAEADIIGFRRSADAISKQKVWQSSAASDSKQDDKTFSYQGYTINFTPDKLNIYLGGDLVLSRKGNFANPTKMQLVAARGNIGKIIDDKRRAALIRSVIQKNKGIQGVAEEKCPHCNGPMVSEELMNEKKDACYYKVKSRYKVWPSAYASGALVKCRKKGADSWGNGSKNEGSILEGIEQADESLHDWFNKEKWVRMDTKGNIKGPCAKEPGEGKPKCLPQAKAHSLGKKGRASAAARKRREDPNPDRSGKAINVNTKKD